MDEILSVLSCVVDGPVSRGVASEEERATQQVICTGTFATGKRAKRTFVRQG